MRFALVCLLVSGSLLAGCMGEKASYPRNYLLYEGELPEGTKLAELTPEMRQMGLEENPAEIPNGYLRGMLQGNEQAAQYMPDVAWAELIARGDDQGGFVLMALFYNDEAKIEQGLGQIKSAAGGQFCSYQKSSEGAGRILRDGPVVVIMGAGDEEMRPYVEPITAKLMSKAPGLKDVCA